MPAPTPIPLFGFRNLATLKARMLPADMGDNNSAYDVDLMAIGQGVAAQFDKITGRELVRNAAARFECPAGLESVVLESYPIESVASALLYDRDQYSDMTASIYATQNASGIVDFGGSLGSHLQKLVITSAGGYWCDAGDTIAMPNGAIPLPDDLLQAWYTQCRATCDAEAIFRQKGAGNFAHPDKRDPSLRLDTLDILPSVKRILQLYYRMP